MYLANIDQEFFIGMQAVPQGMNNFELGRYNEYIEIVKDQISCATEASEILQSSYRNLRKIPENVPGKRNILIDWLEIHGFDFWKI